MTNPQQVRKQALEIHPDDNVAVALADLKIGDEVAVAGNTVKIAGGIPTKHKFALRDFSVGDPILMYGVLVGRATQPIHIGERIGTHNAHHETTPYGARSGTFAWTSPDISRWRDRTFLGYRRSDGQVGTRNHWLVFPLVFCENRNIRILQEAFEKGLGFAAGNTYQEQVDDLADLYRQGRIDEVRNFQPTDAEETNGRKAIFPNVDGVKFLVHEGGCGGTREDARILCGLLAGYLHHPNVAGATVLSLGCQNAQISMLREEIAKRSPKLDKPLLIFD
jgi:altronate hydrolase